jgi:hypothetical protein
LQALKCIDAEGIRERRHSRLGLTSFTGRDVEESERAMRFDKQICTWEILGDAEKQRFAIEREEKRKRQRFWRGLGISIGIAGIVVALVFGVLQQLRK